MSGTADAFAPPKRAHFSNSTAAKAQTATATMRSQAAAEIGAEWKNSFMNGAYVKSERSIGAILGALVFQLAIESVSGIDGQPYNSGANARVGLCFRGGYAFW